MMPRRSCKEEEGKGEIAKRKATRMLENPDRGGIKTTLRLAKRGGSGSSVRRRPRRGGIERGGERGGGGGNNPPVTSP
jgi:hypothetical protein